MSYDLLVFEKTKAPQTRPEFLKWFREEVERGEEPSSQSISTASPALRNWFMEMKEMFPPMNGLYAPDDEQINAEEDLELHLTDYSISGDSIYASFAWSLAEEAYGAVRKAAQRHDVGFFDVSADNGDIILPDGTRIE